MYFSGLRVCNFVLFYFLTALGCSEPVSAVVARDSDMFFDNEMGRIIGLGGKIAGKCLRSPIWQNTYEKENTTPTTPYTNPLYSLFFGVFFANNF